ncbi:hypothetical protein PR202_ga27516 [Eleusine coracana subsp. coracana]|uniref:Diacylglycerol O-acyltransferase n=1 Tax=Eleusine coracana subsp. coracana TaxID=191504 RepID=A0AAV5DGZ4_ELECO|nr:hypothetical protein PR202_ga27516 [Eleusine coracana subsp. coracana]
MDVVEAAVAGLSSVAGPGKQALSVRVSRAATNDDDTWSMVEEPVSPTGRLLDSMWIIVTIGLGAPLDLSVFRAGIDAQLARHPRFRSIQVTDGFKDGNPRWVPATVNLDDHIIVRRLDPAAVAADPDQAVEDYVATLSTLPMDRSRPMWEFHCLDFPTSEATATVALRAHHSLGDSTALLTLLVACTRSVADPTRLPTMPTPARSGQIYAKPRPPASAGARAFVSWLWSCTVLAWNTVMDVVAFLTTVLFISDPHTLFRRSETGGNNLHRKRFVHRTLSLDDVKFIKNTLNCVQVIGFIYVSCTINDVLVGVTSAALSQYYFRNSGDTDMKRLLYFRSILVVNIRPPASLCAILEMIERGNSKDVKWGNRLGYIILPFHIVMHDDPLDYVRAAKRTVDRKKSSLEAIFTNAIGEATLKLFGIKVELCGHPVTFIAPSADVPPQALTIHYQSYNNTIKVILAVDEAQFDHRQLLDDFASSLRSIRDAAVEPRGFNIY